MTRKRNIVERTRRAQKRIWPATRTLESFRRMRDFMLRWPQADRIWTAVEQSGRANTRDGSSHETKAEGAARVLYERMSELIRDYPEEYMEKRGPRWVKLARKLGARSGNQLRLIWRRRTADRK